MEINNISFNGKYIKSTNIVKKNLFGHFNPLNVSLVEIDTFNKKDIKALQDVGVIWNQVYSNEIYDNARYINNMAYRSLMSRFYVLTKQQRNFENLKYNDILATMQVSVASRRKKMCIDFLQVDPQHNYDAENRKYKNIGSSFLNSVVSIFKDFEVTLSSAPTAIEFYLKNGFDLVKGESSMMKLNNKIINKGK